MNRDDTVKGMAGKHSRNKILKAERLYYRKNELIKVRIKRRDIEGVNRFPLIF